VIVSAREPAVARARTTPAVAILPAILVVILSPPFGLYSVGNKESRARPGKVRDDAKHLISSPATGLL
jgi:hypothetical protein